MGEAQSIIAGSRLANCSITAQVDRTHDENSLDILPYYQLTVKT